MEAARTRCEVNANKLYFVFHVLKKMTVDGRDSAKMIAEVEATSWRIRETIRVRELAATHRLGQMRRLLMLKEYKT